MYYVYMIKNSSNKLYISISENPEERVRYHNTKQGAQFTKYTSTSFGSAQDKSLSTGKPDFQIVFTEEYPTLSGARTREIQIKKWRRDKKEMLIKRFKQELPTKC